jgi:hypothetical protein
MWVMGSEWLKNNIKDLILAMMYPFLKAQPSS